jgi:thiamine kinase-like enzyme
MIKRLMPGVDTMTRGFFAERDDAVERAGRALRTLHGSGVQFQFRFELFSIIDESLNILSGKPIDLTEGCHDSVKQAEHLKQALSVRPVTRAPCHCDPLCENFLDDGQQAWIVDH